MIARSRIGHLSPLSRENETGRLKGCYRKQDDIIPN